MAEPEVKEVVREDKATPSIAIKADCKRSGL
jgi:hypothetical protein